MKNKPFLFLFFPLLWSVVSLAEANTISIEFKSEMNPTEKTVLFKDFLQKHTILNQEELLNTPVLQLTEAELEENEFEWTERELLSRLKPVLHSLKESFPQAALQMKIPKKISFQIGNALLQEVALRNGLGKALKEVCARCSFNLREVKFQPLPQSTVKNWSVSFDKDKLRSLFFPFQSSFRIPFVIEDSKKTHYLKADVNWAVTVQCPSTKRDLRSGERLALADIEWSSRPYETSDAHSFTPCSLDVDKNYQIAKTKKKGDIIFASDLIDAPLVQTGQWVRYLVKVGALEATLEGIAQGAGRIGEIIRVRFPRTQRIIWAKVVDENTVVPR